MWAKTFSMLALALGLFFAFYYQEGDNLRRFQIREEARRAAEASGRISWGYTVDVTPPFDRALGVAFGLGLAGLGAFGLYAQARLSGPRTDSPASPEKPDASPR